MAIRQKLRKHFFPSLNFSRFQCGLHLTLLVLSVSQWEMQDMGISNES